MGSNQKSLGTTFRSHVLHGLSEFLKQTDFMGLHTERDGLKIFGPVTILHIQQPIKNDQTGGFGHFGTGCWRKLGVRGSIGVV